MTVETCLVPTWPQPKADRADEKGILGEKHNLQAAERKGWLGESRTWESRRQGSEKGTRGPFDVDRKD